MSRTIAKNHLLFFGLTFLLLVIFYFPQLLGEFIGDDVGRIQDLPFKNSFNILNHNLGDRPLLIISVWLDRFFFHFNVFGMRLENLLWFSLICVVMRGLVTEISNKFNYKISPWIRDGLLLVFALHPLNTQAVGHVIQRGILFSTLLGFVSTWLLIRCEGEPKKIDWKLALLFWCLALMAKPNIAFLPVWWAILLYLTGNKNKIPYLGFFFFMLLIPVVSYKWGEYNVQVASQSLDVWNYFLTQGSSLLHYFRLMLFPWPLHFIHYYGMVMDGSLWPGLFLWGIFIAIFGIIWFRSNNQFFKVFMLGGFLAFLPESSFFPIMHPFFEHRTFTPMAFIVIGLCFLDLPCLRKTIIGCLITVLIIFSSLTFYRSVQIQKYSDWVIDEVSGDACNSGYFVYYNVHKLITREEFDKAQEAVGKVSHCLDLIPLKLLTLELSISGSKRIEPEILNQFKDTLHSDNLVVCHMRNLSNEYILTKMINQKDDSTYCQMEDLLSQQLRYLTMNPKDCLPSIQNYLYSNASCMSSLLSQGKERTYQYLKMRTIMYSYFRKEDKDLDKDLIKAGNDKEIHYLRGMYNMSMKEREILKRINH